MCISNNKALSKCSTRCIHSHRAQSNTQAASAAASEQAQHGRMPPPRDCHLRGGRMGKWRKGMNGSIHTNPVRGKRGLRAP